MSRRILVVKSEAYSFSKLKGLLSPYRHAFDFTFVENRKEASDALKGAPFDKVVTALKIPRLSDGYLFLAQITEKYIKSDGIIVIVDETTDNVITSLNSRGVVHIYSATGLEGVVGALNKANGVSSSMGENAQDDIITANYDLENIKTRLNYVMGPVGNMIFNDVVRRWQDHHDLNELFNLIKNEIKDQNKIDQFIENFGE